MTYNEPMKNPTISTKLHYLTTQYSILINQP